MRRSCASPCSTNVPTACDRATADFVAASPRVHGEYELVAGGPPPAPGPLAWAR